MKNVVIVGATGAVGVEMVNCLKALNFPVGKLRLVASEKSLGRVIKTPFGDVACEVISEKVFEESDIALFSAGGDISKEWRERVVKAGCVMVDNSSAFRYEKDVPLVIPAVNASAAKANSGVIANPNCTTAIAAMALWPLHKKFGLRKVIVSTYQATSGAGAKGMKELVDQTRAVFEGNDLGSKGIEELLDRENVIVKAGDPVGDPRRHDALASAAPKFFAHQIAFNIIPHIDKFQENGYTKEEMKVAWETRKIFGDESIACSCTAVRIPTLRAHSESIVIETREPVSVEAAREVLSAAPGVDLVDDVSKNRYPMPINAAGKFNVEVGRVRQSLIFGDHGLELFVSGDQLLRGAALNAVEIAMLFA
ncbi:aspartate-semialdehyde dehydrogenase [Candidatus Peregrinibacteria bacterium]|nr:aspartate-semialdehyde dehydrogenase [Candidatus Peregrinibacteria bacterium]